MRILFYNDYFYHLGGAETYLTTITDALRSKNIETRIVAFDYSKLLPGTNSIKSRIRSFLKKINLQSDIISLFEKTIQEFKPDVIHVNKNNVYTHSINRVLSDLNIPVVVTIHDYYSLVFKNDIKTVLKNISCRNIDPAPKYIIPNFALYSRLTKIQPGRKVYIPHFVDDMVWAYKCPEPGINNRLLYVGRLERSKGIFVLLEALRRLKNIGMNISLTCIGTGKDEVKFREQIIKYNLQQHIRLIGYQPREVLLKYFHRSSILLYPSLQPELFGLVGIEAQNCGLPVIASRVGGVEEWCIDGLTGMLVPPNDAGALASKIILALNNFELRKNLSENAFKSVRRHFNERNAIEKLINLYRSLL